MSNKPNHQKEYRSKERAKIVPLTSEEIAARELVRKAATEKLQAYTNLLPTLSTNQLRGELRREAKKPSDTSLLTQAFGVVLGEVFKNTKPLGNMNPYLK